MESKGPGKVGVDPATGLWKGGFNWRSFEKWRKHPLLKPGFFNAVSFLPSVTTLLAPPRSCSGSD